VGVSLAGQDEAEMLQMAQVCDVLTPYLAEEAAARRERGQIEPQRLGGRHVPGYARQLACVQRFRSNDVHSRLEHRWVCAASTSPVLGRHPARDQLPTLGKQLVRIAGLILDRNAGI
jgi:hypothetical protein